MEMFTEAVRGGYVHLGVPMRNLTDRQAQLIGALQPTATERSATMRVLVLEADQLLVIGARAFLREELWVSCRHVADCKTAPFATFINEAPGLFMLLYPNLFHLRVTAWAWRER